MTDKTIILITGANRGLGLATAKSLAANSPDYAILIGSRSLSKAQEAVAVLEAEGSKASLSAIEIDVTSPESVAAAVKTVESSHGRLDTLINNAGVNKQGPSLATAVSESLEVNVTGSARVTELFLPLLGRTSDARLIFLTSVLGSLTARSDPMDPWYALPASGYRASKAALNMLMVCYHKDLNEQRIKVFGVCPGFLATDLSGPAEVMRQMGATEPAAGAALVKSVVAGERDADAGRVVAAEGVHPW